MKLYTVLEISEMLKVNKFSVYRWINEGKLKIMKIGKMVRITQEELDRFLSQ